MVRAAVGHLELWKARKYCADYLPPPRRQASRAPMPSICGEWREGHATRMMSHHPQSLTPLRLTAIVCATAAIRPPPVCRPAHFRRPDQPMNLICSPIAARRCAHALQTLLDSIRLNPEAGVAHSTFDGTKVGLQRVSASPESTRQDTSHYVEIPAVQSR